MSIDKFLHLIVQGKLYFSRLSKMTDKYEGTVPELMFRKKIIEILQSESDKAWENIHKEKKYLEEFRDKTFINCWSIDRDESYALWKIYLSGSSCGVAIKTTVSKLRKSLEKVKGNPDFFIGEVDYKVQFPIYPPNPQQLCVYKREFYKYEKELRAFFVMEDSAFNENPSIKELDGWNVDIDINTLIDSIYLSPFTGGWFEASFRSIIEHIKPELVPLIQSSEIKDE